MTARKKLIEVALPLGTINGESQWEKSRVTRGLPALMTRGVSEK